MSKQVIFITLACGLLVRGACEYRLYRWAASWNDAQQAALRTCVEEGGTLIAHHTASSDSETRYKRFLEGLIQWGLAG